MKKDSAHEMITTSKQLPVLFRPYESTNQFIPGHWHAHVEVLMLLDGVMHIGIRDREYTLKPWDILVVNSSDIHDTKSIGHVHTILLQIPYDYLNMLLPHFDLIHFQEFFDHELLQNHTAFQTMQSALRSMFTVFQEESDGYRLLFMANLHEFLYALYASFHTKLLPTEKNIRHTARLKEILSYINQHYQEPITLQQMADMSSLNPEYFCRMFKRYTGTTLLEYTNQVRLMHIHEELLHTDDTITDILERNGFSNYKVFSRMFHETYQATPSALRKR